MQAAGVNRSAWRDEGDAESDTPMLCDALNDIEAPLRAAAASQALDNDPDDGEDKEDWAGERGADASGDGDGGEALDAWLDQCMEQIPSSSTTDAVVNIVKRAALQFGEAARLALLSRRMQQLAEDEDLGVPGQEEERDLARLRSCSERVRLRCAYDEMVCFDPSLSTFGGGLGGTRTSARPGSPGATARASGTGNNSTTKLTRHRMRACIESLLRLQMSYDQFDRFFRRVNGGRDSDLNFQEFLAAFETNPSKAMEAGQQIRHIVQVLGGLWRALLARGTTLEQEFMRLDRNLSGDASLAEFCSFLRDLSKDGSLHRADDVNQAVLSKHDMYTMTAAIDQDGDGQLELSEIRSFFFQVWRQRLQEMDDMVAAIELEHELQHKQAGAEALARREKLERARRERGQLRTILSDNFPRHVRDELSQTRGGIFDRLVGHIHTQGHESECTVDNMGITGEVISPGAGSTLNSDAFSPSPTTARVNVTVNPKHMATAKSCGATMIDATGWLKTSDLSKCTTRRSASPKKNKHGVKRPPGRAHMRQNSSVSSISGTLPRAARTAVPQTEDDEYAPEWLRAAGSYDAGVKDTLRSVDAGLLSKIAALERQQQKMVATVAVLRAEDAVLDAADVGVGLGGTLDGGRAIYHDDEKDGQERLEHKRHAARSRARRGSRAGRGAAVGSYRRAQRAPSAREELELELELDSQHDLELDDQIHGNPRQGKWTLRGQQSDVYSTQARNVTKPRPPAMYARDKKRLEEQRKEQQYKERLDELEAEEADAIKALRMSRGKPPAGLLRREEEARQRRERKMSTLREVEAEDKRRHTFRARPVPATSTSKSGNAFDGSQMAEEMRRQRIARRADEMMRSAELPPRMKLWAAIQEGAEKDNSKTTGGRAGRRRPFRAKKAPNFAQLQQRWSDTLSNARGSFRPTTAEPFSMCSKERLEAEEKKRRSKREAQRAKEKREREFRRAQRDAARAEALESGPKKAPATTRSTELKAEHLQKARRMREAEAAAAVQAHAERKAKIQAASERVATDLRRRDRQRRRESQETPKTAAEKMQDFNKASRERARALKARIGAARDTAPTLLELHDERIRLEEAKRKAVAAIAKSLYTDGSNDTAGHVPNVDNMTAADDEYDVFADDEKALLGVTD